MTSLTIINNVFIENTYYYSEVQNEAEIENNGYRKKYLNLTFLNIFILFIEHINLKKHNTFKKIYISYVVELNF